MNVPDISEIDEEWYPTPAEELETALITLTELDYKVRKRSVKSGLSLPPYIQLNIDELAISLNRVEVNLISEMFPHYGNFVNLFYSENYCGLISRYAR